MFDDIWRKIILNELKTFKRKNGMEFRYYISKNKVIIEGIDYPLCKEDFIKVYEFKKNMSYSEIDNYIIGAKYIYPMLEDKRILE